MPGPTCIIMAQPDIFLDLSDPVDPRTGSFVGMNAQCVQFSPEHNAVVVSMGNGGSCNTVRTITP